MAVMIIAELSFREFLGHLEQCDSDPVQIAECFVQKNEGFVIYTDYCTNYPRSVL